MKFPQWFNQTNMNTFLAFISLSRDFFNVESNQINWDFAFDMLLKYGLYALFIYNFWRLQREFDQHKADSNVTIEKLNKDFVALKKALGTVLNERLNK